MLGLLLAFPEVFAISLTPPLTEMAYAPDAVYGCYFKVRNTEDTPLNVVTFSRGAMNDSIWFGYEELTLEPHVWKEIPCTITLPPTLKPGDHVTVAGVVEKSTEVGGLSARAGIGQQIIVRVPYPGKYLEGSLDAPDTKASEDVLFSFTLTNRGTEEVDRATGTLEVFDDVKMQLASLTTESAQGIRPEEKAVLTARWPTSNQRLGIYSATGRVGYDGLKTEEFEQEFRIGDILVIVPHVEAATVNRGDIAEIKISMESSWNREIRDLFAEASIRQGDREIARIRTPLFDLAPWEKKTITAYWTTSETEAGTYQVDADVHYAGRIARKSTQIRIRSGLESFTRSYGLVLLILILLIAFSAWNIRRRPLWPKKRK